MPLVECSRKVAIYLPTLPSPSLRDLEAAGQEPIVWEPEDWATL